MSVVRELQQAIGERQKKLSEELPAWGPKFFSDVISQEDNQEDKERIDGENVHVSSLSGWCARQYALFLQSADPPPARPVTGGHRVMWAMGKAAEHHMRTQFMKRVNYAGVIGNWFCRCKRRHSYKVAKPDVTCRICGTTVTDYEELDMVHDEYHVTGHPDMLVMIRGKLRVWECKSMNVRDWNSLTQPLGDNLFQVTSYVKLVTEIIAPAWGVKPDLEATIMYVAKDFKWGSPYKEFQHKPTAQEHKMVDKAFVEAKQAIERPKGRLPKRTLCSSIHCSRATKCPVANECFALKS